MPAPAKQRSCDVWLSKSIKLNLFSHDAMNDGFRLWIGGESGAGKALALDTYLPTPTGWTTIGKVKVGDTLFDEEGWPCRVTAATPVMPGRPCFELEFDTGEKIIADAEHQWWTFTAPDRHQMLKGSAEFRDQRRAARPLRGQRTVKSRRPEVPITEVTGALRTTEEMARQVRWGQARNEANHSIRVAPGLHDDGEDVELPLDPYVLGVWLGDGHSKAGRITTADAFIVEELRQRGFPCTKATGKYAYKVHGLGAKISALRVRGAKHVPNIYFRASRQQRLELLQGLLDTDGTSSGGAIEFCNTKYNLAMAVAELARSLGHKVSIKEGLAKLYGRVIGPRWRLSWTPYEYVFKLPRKRKTQRIGSRETLRWHYVVKMTRIPSVPVRCISVDSPNRMYLASESMIPTHNSSATMLVAEQAIQHGQVIVLDAHGEHGNLWSVSPSVTRRFGYGGDAVDLNSVQWCIDEVAAGKSLLVDLSHWTDIYPARLDQFILEFMRNLYELRRKHPKWTLVVLEEAQNVIPQQQMAGQADNIRMMLGMITGGRKYGLQFILTSQQQSLVEIRAVKGCNTRLFLRATAKEDWKHIRPYLPPSLSLGFKSVKEDHDITKLASGEGAFLSRWTPDTLIRLRMPETKLRKPLQDAMGTED